MQDKKKDKYTNFSNVEVMKNYVIPEEFAEGPYGSPVNHELGKEENKRSYSAFNYEDKTLHQDIPRQYPGVHVTHDDETINLEKPYQDISQKS